MPRYFSPREANELLFLIRPMMEEMLSIGATIRAHQPELWALVKKSAGNGGNPALSGLIREFDRLDELLHKVQDLGALVKDLQTGLLDFPCFHDGREIYLCWRMGEEEVHYWHDIEAGFSGRQLIDWE